MNPRKIFVIDLINLYLLMNEREEVALQKGYSKFIHDVNDRYKRAVDIHNLKLEYGIRHHNRSERLPKK
jgi:hypothetical protein